MNFELVSASNPRNLSTTLIYRRFRYGSNAICAIILLSCLNLYAFAEESDSPKAESTRALPDPGLARQTTLSNEVPEKELVWLDVSYPEHSATNKVIALEQEPRKPNAQGAVLILPDKGQHADWPGIVRQLRNSLPDSGWFTLAINLPFETDPEEHYSRVLEPKNTDQITVTETIQSQLSMRGQRTDKQNGDESDSTESTPPPSEVASEDEANTAPVDIDLDENKTEEQPQISYQEKAIAHLKAGMDYITTKGYRNIILISIGNSSNVALTYIEPLAQQFKNQGFAFIMIDAQLSEQFEEDISSALGEEFQAPVLDIVNGARQTDEYSYKKRMLMARATNTKTYQQVELASISSTQESKTLLKRIDSWLKVYAPGMAARKVKK